MEIYKLRKPEITLEIDNVLQRIDTKEISSYVESTSKPRYLFWDKVRYKPRPDGITAEEFWSLIKLFRKYSANRVKAVVRDVNGDYFTWQPLPGLDYFLHEVDMQLGGALESTLIEDQSTRRRFITRGIMEEAIASSQLEGASTSRRFAKRMLLEKRKPSNRSEKMIINNYQAMLEVEEELRHQDLSLDMLLHLHSILTKDTIDSKEIGRFRKDQDNIVVCDTASQVVYHEPPPEKLLKKELVRFIKYANGGSKEHQFVHPLIKAIILHFWVGYLHPFTDGNGRLARTIFYWFLLRKGYWAFSYLPISRVIRNSSAQYRDAYIYSEQDDNDLTYFIDYNVRKLSQAKREFEEYVERKEIENRKMVEVARDKYHLNDRQTLLLRHLYKNSSATTSIKVHSHVNSISKMTARKDLEELERLGFLTSQKLGRERPFKGTDKLLELFS